MTGIELSLAQAAKQLHAVHPRHLDVEHAQSGGFSAKAFNAVSPSE